MKLGYDLPQPRKRRRTNLLQLGASSSSAARAMDDGESAIYRDGPAPVLFYIKVKIGMPPQEFLVAVDTGSGNIVVPSMTCQSLACLSHRSFSEMQSATAKPIVNLEVLNETTVPPSGNREKASVHMGLGSITGDLTEDIVCLEQPGTCARTGVIIATEMSQEPFSIFPYDGVLGLGLTASSIEPRFNLMGNFAEHHVLGSSKFALWFANDGEGDDSEITFGTWKKERLGSGVLWLPVDYQTGIWQVPLKDVAVDSEHRDQCQGGCNALFDTGTNAIGMPQGMLEAVLGELNVAKDCSNFKKLPTFGFVFGDHILSLDPWEYVKKTASSSCYPQLFGIDIPPPKGPLVLLGTPFLRRYYTIYDRSSLKIGLALAAHANNKNGEDDSEIAARLVKFER